MSKWLRLSDHPKSQSWLSQFRTGYDRAGASRLLNQLVLVSIRQFETSIERALCELQTRLNATLAIYPILPPIPDEIAGYDLFSGGIPRESDAKSYEVGRRRKYGSEDRVGHMLTKLQNQMRAGGTTSRIEVAPTLVQLKTQGLRHIVLVDDICGSGQRIANFWKVVPRRIKSLLSYKRCELWIVLYGITPTGRKELEKHLPNFPIETHLITVLPESDLQTLSPELLELCDRYARDPDFWEGGMGYHGAACPIVFEHGCPNGVPAILWMQNNGWAGLFPNRSIPADLRPLFDSGSGERPIEELWRANQPQLALNLLDALDRTVPLGPSDWMLLTLLGLRLRGVAESTLAKRVMMTNTDFLALRNRASQMGLYDLASRKVTLLGKEFVARFRATRKGQRAAHPIAVDPLTYYPGQCEGKLRNLAKPQE